MTEDRRAQALIDEMRRKAEVERSEIERQAGSSVMEIRNRTEAEAARLKGEALRELEAELEDLSRQRGLAAEMEAAAARSQLRALIIEEVFQEAAARLESFTRGEGSLPFSYDETFCGLVVDAARGVGCKGSMKVYPADAGRCREALAAAGIDMAVEASAENPGTALAVSEDGLQLVDNSVFERLTRARTRLAPLVLQTLEG